MLFFKRKLVFILLILSKTVFGQVENEKNIDLVESLSEAYRSAVLEENTEKIIAMLHPEVMYHPPSGAPISGKDTVGKLIISFLDKNDVTEWQVFIDKTVDLDDSLLEFGHFEILENGETYSERKYINIWQKDQGEYKLYFRGWSPL